MNTECLEMYWSNRDELSEKEWYWYLYGHLAEEWQSKTAEEKMHKKEKNKKERQQQQEILSKKKRKRRNTHLYLKNVLNWNRNHKERTFYNAQARGQLSEEHALNALKELPFVFYFYQNPEESRKNRQMADISLSVLVDENGLLVEKRVDLQIKSSVTGIISFRDMLQTQLIKQKINMTVDEWLVSKNLIVIATPIEKSIEDICEELTTILEVSFGWQLVELSKEEKSL